MIIKILIAIIIYLIFLILVCTFFKNATRLGNIHDEIVESKKILKKLNVGKNKND